MCMWTQTCGGCPWPSSGETWGGRNGAQRDHICHFTVAPGIVMLRFPWTGEVCEGLLEYGFPVMVVVEQAEEFAWLSHVQYTVPA